MYATANGAHTGVPLAVAKEFVASDHPGKLPEYKRRADGGANDNSGNDAISNALALLRQLPPSSIGDLSKQTGSGRPPQNAAVSPLNPNDPVSAALLLTRQHFSGGGGMMTVPFFERSEARNVADDGGFSAGFGGGRTDKNNVDVGAGSYILPADIVAGLGEGNSLAGAKVWDTILHSGGPYGIEAPRIHPAAGAHLPRAPSDPELAKGIFEGNEATPITPTLADGGQSDQGSEGKVPIAMADGEIVVTPDEVAQIGARYFPSHRTPTRRVLIKYGHDVLDHFVKERRGRNIKELRSLPGPAGSKNPKQGHNSDAAKD